MDLPPPYSSVVDTPNSKNTDPFNKSNSQILCISLTRSGQIHLIGFKDKNLVNQVKNAIQTGWGIPVFTYISRDGILVELNPCNFKLGFKSRFQTQIIANCGPNNKGTYAFLRAMMHLFACMAKNGWNLIQSVEATMNKWDKDTFYFESTPPDPEAWFFTISFLGDNKIHLLDCPEMQPILTKVIKANWSGGVVYNINHHIKQNHPTVGCIETQLWGCPFYQNKFGYTRSRVSAKFLMGQIIQAFRSNGYKLYTTLTNDKHDMESWIFRKITPNYH